VFWSIVEACGSQMRSIGMGGVIGFEHAAFHEVARAWDYPAEAVVAFLPFAETGLLEGLAEHKPDG
jgi:hypothetical protein